MPESNFLSRWNIYEMEVWGRDAIDLIEPGFIEFTSGIGSLGFIAVQGAVHHDICMRGNDEAIEFTWIGDDEGDDVSGRGWAILTKDGELSGMIYFHQGDKSWFKAKRFPAESSSRRKRSPSRGSR